MFHDLNPGIDRPPEYDTAPRDLSSRNDGGLDMGAISSEHLQENMAHEADGEPQLELRRHEDAVPRAAGRAAATTSFEISSEHGDGSHEPADNDGVAEDAAENTATENDAKSDETEDADGGGSHSGGNDGGSHDGTAEAGDDDEENDRPIGGDTPGIVNMDLLSGGSPADIEQVGNEVVAAIKAGKDVVAGLNSASREAPEEAAELAYTIRDGIIADEATIAQTSTDTLIWVRAALTLGEAESDDIAGAAYLDGVLRERLGSEHARDKLGAATFWADSDDKTVGRVHELTGAMDALEAGLAQPDETRTRELLAANLREGVRPPLEGYDFQPVTATYAAYDNPYDPEGSKHTIVGNNHHAAVHGGNRYGFHGSAPLGVVLTYNDAPLMLTTFDVHGPDVTIHQMQGANKYGVERPDGRYEEVDTTPNRIANFDMSGLAISTVARVVDDLGLVPDPAQANLRIISAQNCPDVNPLDSEALSLERAEKIYDIPAQDRHMDTDDDGNWTKPLRELL